MIGVITDLQLVFNPYLLHKGVKF